MNRLSVLLIISLLFGMTAVVAGDPDPTQVQASVDAKTKDDADAGIKREAERRFRASNYQQMMSNNLLSVQFTSGVGSDVLQAVGQAVLKKAVRAGWLELETKLSELARCAKNDALANTCKVFGQARIEDLIASPRILLEAFVADLLVGVQAKLGEVSGVAPVAALAGSWVVLGPDAIKRHVAPWLAKQLKGLDLGACPPDKAKAVAWVLATCFVDSSDISACSPTERARACAVADADRDDIARVADLGVSTFQAISDDAQAKLPALSLQLFFEWAKLADAKHQDALDSFETIFVGLLARDWTRAVIGIGHLAGASKIDMKLVRIIGAVGQFAETYASGNKTIDPTAAREKVIEDLITSLVDRNERDHGAVISLGGAFGLSLGTRVNDSGHQLAMPVRLALGLGIDTYGASKAGFHGSLDAFDLGQYVTYSSGSLDVGSPDIKSGLIVGATAGYWFANRNTPVFVALHGSASPFVRTPDNKPTYEFGAMFGIYVPLLDFN